MKRILLTGLAATALAVPIASVSAHGYDPDLRANPDSYSTANKATLAVDARHGILGNDRGDDPQLLSHTEPEHGTLTLENDGSFGYVPDAGFSGTDSFNYSIADSVHLFKTELPPIGSFGGVALSGGAFGSSLAPVPGRSHQFYGLEDRGPNVEAPNKHAVEPLPSYDPAIARFKFSEGRAVLQEKIPLLDSEGHPFSGLVNTQAPTGEIVENIKGHQLAHDPDGYDPEGLVAMADGSFWVSDEYGPFVAHFNSRGREIGRLSPFDGSLPAELAKRVPNRGLEGLTVTPDGKTLVATMQSALQQADLPAGVDAKKAVVPTRIVTYGLRTHELHEYLFLLDEPATTGVANSEITALSNTTFLIDERDGKFPEAGGYKKLWKVDISNATDVGPQAKVKGATYDPANGGLLVGGKTIEALTVGQKTAEAGATLNAAGITTVKQQVYLDVDAFLLGLDPSGTFFSHDKLEGVAVLNGGKRLVLSNDNDFGISGISNTAAPWQLIPKVSPTTGKQDEGEYLEIDTSDLPAPDTASATVTITVPEAH
jgi:hypothetical protein